MESSTSRNLDDVAFRNESGSRRRPVEPLAYPLADNADSAQQASTRDEQNKAVEQSLEFANSTMFRVRSLYLTKNKGIVPGVVEGSCDYVRFYPNETKTVLDFGKDLFTLRFEYEDLLEPNTQRQSPNLEAKTKLGPGFALHREQSEPDSGGGKPPPVFLEIRVRLVFGVVPTPDTTASYWFAVTPKWIDRIYNILANAAKLHETEPWHIISAVGEDEAASRANSGLSSTRISSSNLEQEEITLRNDSILLKPLMVSSIKKHLPARLRFSEWSLEFSTYEHGLSVNNMYRMLAPHQDMPCITVIRDMDGCIFGCYTTETWKKIKEGSNHYYGAGESFVFMIHPEPQFFNWSGSNSLFMMSTEREVMIGGGSGAASIWLDGDLTRGCSRPSKTFNNICLAGSTDFHIAGIEVWVLLGDDE